MPISVTAINVAIAVAVDHLISVDKDQVCSMGLLYALRKGLLFASNDHLLVATSCPMAAGQRRVCQLSCVLLVLEATRGR